MTVLKVLDVSTPTQLSASRSGGDSEKRSDEHVEDYFNDSDQHLDASDSRLRKRAIVTQVGAPTEMAFISQPSTVPNLDGIPSEYVYDDSAGAGIVVYSLDYGAFTFNPVRQNYQHHKISADRVSTHRNFQTSS